MLVGLGRAGAARTGRASVAENRLGAARLDRRQPDALTCQIRGAKRVHATVFSVEAAGGHTPLDRVGAEPRPPKLGEGDHAVLVSGEVRDQPIWTAVVALWVRYHLQSDKPAGFRPPARIPQPSHPADLSAGEAGCGEGVRYSAGPTTRDASAPA